MYRLLLVVVLTVSCYGLPNETSQEDPGVTRLREYLRFQSAHPEPHEGYVKCVNWLQNQAQEIGLEYHYLNLTEPNEFAVWLTWTGTNPNLKSILLNSHMDVVNADPDKWTSPPFDADKDSEGNIIARGASDMKSATVAELEAIRKLKNSGFQPLRTIHLTILPEEELGGIRGMEAFVKTNEFKNLNIAVDIDEGFPDGSPSVIPVTYGEKAIWQFKISVKGESMHASNMPEVTAGHRLQVIINKLMEYRESELEKLKNPNTNKTIEDITSLNLVKLGGGIGDNIIPNELWAQFDMRVLLQPDWNFTDAENLVVGIVEEARLGGEPDCVNLTWILQPLAAKRTVINETNVWWTELQNTCTELNVSCEPHILAAATDGKQVRELDIPVFGICPFPNSPPVAHIDDEFINEIAFLEGIDRYVTLIRNFANLPESLHP